MAYGEAGENARMLLRTVRLTFDGAGRSRRTEVVYWWFATALAGVVLGFIAMPLLPPAAGLVTGYLLRGIFVIPMFALFARRLHDQGRSGWWALLLPLSIALSLPDAVRWIAGDARELLAYEQRGVHPLRWIAGAASVATLLLLLLPGTIGSNRYGEDPREAESEGAS